MDHTLLVSKCHGVAEFWMLDGVPEVDPRFVFSKGIEIAATLLKRGNQLRSVRQACLRWRESLSPPSAYAIARPMEPSLEPQKNRGFQVPDGGKSALFPASRCCGRGCSGRHILGALQQRDSHRSDKFRRQATSEMIGIGRSGRDI
jgi:hypothetical protein